jgi:UDP-N-acetylmuramate dehydrogenase
MSWRTQANLTWLASLSGVICDHPLAKHTSFNIGGPADFFIEAGEDERLQELIDGCCERGIPYRLLGAGTNLLVSDAGVEGLVLRCISRGHRIEGERLYAAAGLKMMRVARIAADADLVGFEWAIGVPGTIGGAVYQNAGCWGSELVSVLLQAEGFAPGKGWEVWPPGRLGLGYRTSALRDGDLRGMVVTGAWLRLTTGDGAAGRRLMAKLTAERVRTQPIKTKNCGSVFKNPPGDSAGRLVETAGLKGAREGDAQVSEQHANFIVNHGEARAADVARLVERVQAGVRSRFGVDLETEVERIGRW